MTESYYFKTVARRRQRNVGARGESFRLGSAEFSRIVARFVVAWWKLVRRSQLRTSLVDWEVYFTVIAGSVEVGLRPAGGVGDTALNSSRLVCTLRLCPLSSAVFSTRGSRVTVTIACAVAQVWRC